ncbi:MAG: potassium transporter [Methylococcales bacterium]|jgi:trk system potassium uptake protein|nr:potassium transporter [Methylococcales bacterium]MBT7442751.1 potassium transporter [Methylococcales bacterium]
MQLSVIQKILGLLLMVSSLTFLPSGFVGLIYGDGAVQPFFESFLIVLTIGVVCWFPARNKRKELRTRDGFVVVVMFWTVLGLSGAVPFILSTEIDMSVIDSVFESISGLTTTGATVITEIDQLPHSILFYRQMLQWIGGMGIIVLAVAVLPMLGIGGMQLYKAETPGPMKDNKLTPRITETAKALWYIYFGLTVLCALSYWLAGMSGFDAISHSFATVAIGGFSTHDQSIGYFDSHLIEMIAVVFMLLSAANFALHFVAMRKMSVKPYLADTEFRVYISVLFVVAILTVSGLYWGNNISDAGEAFFTGVFQAVSIGTTTGFTTAQYHEWRGYVPLLLILASFMGGCAGSTGGGMKVIRVLLLFKQGLREITRLVHPTAQIPVRVGKKTIPPRVIDAVWGFFALYMVSFTVIYLYIASPADMELVTAFSAVAACINNLGPGLGAAAITYVNFDDSAKGLLCFAMLLGRLEIFTLLVLFTPTFWRT